MQSVIFIISLFIIIGLAFISLPAISEDYQRFTLLQSWYDLTGYWIPEDVATDNFGNILMTDIFNHRIIKLSPDGKILKIIGSKGIGDCQFSNPCGISLDKEGNIYVADTYNNRIQKLSADGDFIAKWGTKGKGDGQFYYPCDISIDSSNNIYVADTYNNRIQKFSSDGIFLKKWGGDG